MALDNVYIDSENNKWYRGNLIGNGYGGFVYKTITLSGETTNSVIKITSQCRYEQDIYRKILTPSKLKDGEELFGHKLYLPKLLAYGEKQVDKKTLLFIVIEEMTPYKPKLPLPDVEFKQLCSDLLDSLEYIHTHKLAHCDIKTDNILTKDNRFYLTDFSVTTEVSTEPQGPVEPTCFINAPLEYAGLDMHSENHGPSYRSDLQSLIFCALEWAGYRLPWKKRNFQKGSASPENFYETKFACLDFKFKVKTTPYKLNVLKQFSAHSMAVSFGKQLDYKKLREILHA